MLRTTGRKKNLTRWLLVSFRANDIGYFRFGLTVSSKVGTAVVRNKLKRWCRGYIQNSTKVDKLKGVDINVIFRPVSGEFYKKLLKDDLEQALDRFFVDFK